MEKEDNGRDRFAMKKTDPHSPSPSPGPQDVRITEEMLEAAGAAYKAAAGGQFTPYTHCLRAALKAALAQSDAHAEVIPDCPTEGVAARQGNGG